MELLVLFWRLRIEKSLIWFLDLFEQLLKGKFSSTFFRQLHRLRDCCSCCYIKWKSHLISQHSIEIKFVWLNESIFKQNIMRCVNLIKNFKFIKLSLTHRRITLKHLKATLSTNARLLCASCELLLESRFSWDKIYSCPILSSVLVRHKTDLY